MSKHWTYEEDLFYLVLRFDLMITGSFLILGLKRSSQRDIWLSKQGVKIGLPSRTSRAIRQRRNLVGDQHIHKLHNLNKDQWKECHVKFRELINQFFDEHYDGPNKEKLNKLHRRSEQSCEQSYPIKDL